MLIGALEEHAIGVNLGVFSCHLDALSLQMPPLRGLGLCGRVFL